MKRKKEEHPHKLAHNIFYLVGPIDNAKDFGRSWRIRTSEFLWSLGCGVMDPTDKPTNLITEDEHFLSHIKRLKKEHNYEEVVLILKKIVTSDLAMVDRSDIAIAYLNNEIQMTGTIHEIILCALQKKPCLIVCEQGKENIPNWLFGIGLDHNLFFDTWNDLEDFLKSVDDGTITDFNDDWKFIDYKKVFNK